MIALHKQNAMLLSLSSFCATTPLPSLCHSHLVSLSLSSHICPCERQLARTKTWSHK